MRDRLAAKWEGREREREVHVERERDVHVEKERGREEER